VGGVANPECFVIFTVTAMQMYLYASADVDPSASSVVRPPPFG
jgi:hypothetical protein